MSRHAPLPRPARPLPNRSLVTPGRIAPLARATPLARALPAPSLSPLDAILVALKQLLRSLP